MNFEKVGKGQGDEHEVFPQFHARIITANLRNGQI